MELISFTLFVYRLNATEMTMARSKTDAQMSPFFSTAEPPNFVRSDR